MNVKKRPVVQLTSLLDLLFIMIFIGLLTPYTEPPASEQKVETDTTLQKKVSKLQYELEKMKQRLQVVKENEESQTSPSGQYRELFVANLFYLDGKYRYKETKAFFGNNDRGIFSYRLNLTDSGVYQGAKKPMTLSEVDNFKSCSSVKISYDKIVEECKFSSGMESKLDCDRSNEDEYQCKLYQVRSNAKGLKKKVIWDYKMELIKILDNDLKRKKS
jgi:hypothetical protein